MAGTVASVQSLHIHLGVSSYVEADAQMEAEMALLVYVVGAIAGVCPLHLFLDVCSDVYI